MDGPCAVDGTNEYAGGAREAVTCLMGVSVDGSPVAGIIGQPFHGYERGLPEEQLGRTVWGGRGLGVRGLGQVGGSARMIQLMLPCCSRQS